MRYWGFNFSGIHTAWNESENTFTHNFSHPEILPQMYRGTMADLHFWAQAEKIKILK